MKRGYHLREDQTGIELIDDIEVHFLELPKLDEQAVSIKEGGLVNWLLFLKGADQSKWEVLTMNEPVLKKAMDTLEFLSQDLEARSEGKAEAKKEVARKLLALEVDLAVIAEASGLSEEEIRTLKPLQ